MTQSKKLANERCRRCVYDLPPSLPLLNPRDSVYPARSVFFSPHQTIEICSTDRNEQ